MTASEHLARFVASTRYEDLPADVVSAAKRYLIDTLGVAIRGAKTEAGMAVQAYLEDIGGPAEASVVGTRLRASRIDAAFANGALIRAVEMEDVFEESMFHAAPAAIGVPFALIEHHGCTGRDLLTAVILGYEVGARVARAVAPSHAARGFHPTGTCGTFGAAAAACKLMGLTEPQIVAALGMAGIRAAGLMQSDKPGWRHLTCLNGGSGAYLGVQLALLARHGFPGNREVFEDQIGFCAMHADAFDPSTISAGLGSEYVMLGGGLKLFPSSRFTHAGIAAAIALKKRHEIDPEAVEEVVVRGFAVPLFHTDKPNPDTELDGQGSQQFTVAVVLTKGSYTIEHVSPATLRNPALRRLMGKIRLQVDPELEEARSRDPAKWPTVVEVRMRSGETYREQIDYVPGSAHQPPTAAQLADKYRLLLGGVLPERQVQELWHAVERLDETVDLRPFVRLWQPPQ